MTKKILVAPDSFKGSLSAKEVALTIKNIFSELAPQTQIKMLPLADGGEGSLDFFECQYSNFSKYICKTIDPLGRSITAKWIVIKDLAIIEMAQASGLTLLQTEELNPTIASSFGTGLIIKDVLDKGYKNILITMGGSATVDAGTGLLSALGVVFSDRHGKTLQGNGQNLLNIHNIDITSIHPYLSKATINIACDVNHFLLGKNGAVYTFAPQKGATKEMLPILERGMLNYKNVIKKVFNKNIDTKFGGVAGGTAISLWAILEAQLTSGAELITQHSKFNSYLVKADILITGEGQLDQQTFENKLPYFVASEAKKLKKQTIAIVGNSLLNTQYPFDDLYSLSYYAKTQQEAIKHPQKYLREIIQNIITKEKLL